MKQKITGLCVFITLALVLLSSCASTFEQAGNALAQGDYTTAIAKSLESIAKGKDTVEAEAVLQEAWKRANSEWEAQIVTLEKGTKAEELSNAIDVYNKLIKIHKMVATAGRANLNPSTDALMERANDTKQRLADLYVNQALAMLELGGRDNAKKAVLQFTIAKKMNPEYYGIDSFIEKAIKQATIKVFVFPGPESNYSFNVIEMISMVEDQLDALEFVEVVRPPQHYVAPIGDDHDAKNFARGHGADVMVHFQPSTSLKLTAHEDIRPINSKVQVASNWQVGKSYMVASGTSDVKYILVDLKTEKNIAEGSFVVKDSTDFGFSISSIRHSGKKEKLQFSGMASPQVFLVNTLTQDQYHYYLADQLKSFEKVDLPKFGFDVGMTTARKPMLGLPNFDKFKSPAELVREDNINGHTFFLFDAIKYGSETLANGSSVDRYIMTYNDFNFGEGTDAKLEAAEFDKQIYTDLMSWMKKIASNTDEATIGTFLGGFYTETVPRKIVEKISPVLK